MLGTTPNIDEVSVVGTARTRCYSVRIMNNANQLPTLTLYKERYTEFADGEELHKATGQLEVAFNPEDPRHLLLYSTINEIFIEELAKEKAEADRLEQERLAAENPVTGEI